MAFVKASSHVALGKQIVTIAWHSYQVGAQGHCQHFNSDINIRIFDFIVAKIFNIFIT